MNFTHSRTAAHSSNQSAIDLGAVAAAGAAGVGLATEPKLILLLVVAGFGAAYLALTRLKPVWCIAIVLGALAYVPAAGLPLRSAAHPAVFLGLGIVAMAVTGLAFRARVPPRGGLNLIDAGVGLLALGILGAAIAGTEAQAQVAATALLWLVPYAVGRIVARAGHAESLVRLIVLFAVTLVPLAVLEAVSHRNLFFETFTYVQPLESETLNKFERLGHLRVRTGWRHPILFAMFLTSAASLAALLALRAQGRARLTYVVAAGVLTATQLLTYSRTGWLLLAVVGLLVAVSRRDRLWSRRERPLTIAALVALLALAALPQTQALFGGNGEREIQTSSQYRTALTEQALEPGFFAPLGRTEVLLGPDGMTSIDNAFIIVGWEWGYLGLAGIVLMLVGAAVRAVRSEDAIALGLSATAAALLVALTGVALFGQLQIFVFLVLGAAAGAPLREDASSPAEAAA